MFLRKDWREVYEMEKDIYYRSAILRGLLKDSRDPTTATNVRTMWKTSRWRCSNDTNQTGVTISRRQVAARAVDHFEFSST